MRNPDWQRRRSGYEFVQLDVALLDNPKIIEVGPLGCMLHIAAILWCGRHLSDGLIPKRRVSSLLDLGSLQVSETTRVRVLYGLTVDDLTTDLVRVGLWHDRGLNYEVHDFLVYNRSRASADARREATRLRMQRYRERQRERKTVTRHSRVTHASLTRDVTPPLRSRSRIYEQRREDGNATEGGSEQGSEAVDTTSSLMGGRPTRRVTGGSDAE